MKLHSTLLFVAITLAGCASVRGEPSIDGDVTNAGVSICKLATQGLAVGLTARIAATYRTDGSHYAYLLSRGCGKHGVLDVIDMEPITQETVKRFYDAGDQRCVKNGTPYLCVLEANVDGDIQVIRGQDGKFAAKFLEVHSFSFIKPSS